MQFCSLHHRVLLFIIIILTLNTAPGSSLEVFPTRGILHHPVKLPCKHQCSGLLKWSLRENRDDVQAQCDQTSCRSEKEGFTISHDQYLRGDLSLTITAADYSLRNIYACECRDIDFSFVRLVIETVFSVVQVKFYEDLKLHVSVPEPVEVIYKSSGSSDEVICRVNKTSLWCKDEYRDRTSLTYPEITLRHMEPRDSGRYTIRDTKNEEDIEIYAVSVEEKPFPTWGIVLIVLLLILLCCFAAVGLYLLWRHRKRKELGRRLLRVVQLVQQAEGEEEISKVEKKLDELEELYKDTEYGEDVSKFCRRMKSQLSSKKLQNYEELKTERDELLSKLEEVTDGLEKIRDEVVRGSDSPAEINKMQEELKNFIERYKEKRREEKRREEKRRGA